MKKKKAQRTSAEQRQEKVMRLAHHILTKTIEPANLKLEEVVDILTLVAKGIVLSNTLDEDLEDRSEMIEWIGGRFIMGLDEIDPLAEIPHAWIIPPQGLITEPVGILWSGSYGEDADEGVRVVLDTELEMLRTEIAEDPSVGLIVIEGVEGIAIIDPEWDGESTVTCANPQCGRVHDADLQVAENLFQQAVEHRRNRAAPN